MFLQQFVRLLADPNEKVQKEGWQALAAVTSRMNAEDMQRHITSVRHALRAAKNEELYMQLGYLPGFCIPKFVSK